VEILDWSRVRFVHLTVLTFITPALLGYGGLLLVICYYLEGLIEIGAFVVIQIIIGLTLSRLAFVMGTRAQEVLGFQDPSRLDPSWIPCEEPITRGEIRRLFEKMQLALGSDEKVAIDDLNDVSWFTIVVWAMVSIILFGFIGQNILLCISPAFILTVSCIALYRNGYHSKLFSELDDILDHLEYLVISRLDSFSELLDKVKVNSYVCWMRKTDKQVLDDIVTRIVIKENDPKNMVKIEHNIGLPSVVKETLKITIMNESLYNTILGNTQVLVNTRNWVLSENDTKEEKIIILINTENSPDWGDFESLISSPSQIQYESNAIRELLEPLIPDG